MDKKTEKKEIAAANPLVSTEYLAYSPVFIYIQTCVLSKFKQYSNLRTL